jgi:hypothetical protein
MKKIATILFVFLNVTANAWFVLDNGKCHDGKDIWSPESLLSSSSAKCQQIQSSATKTVLQCKSDVRVYNGTKVLYPELKDCIQDGGNFDQNKFSAIKAKWRKNYDSKLWSYMLDTCAGKMTACSKSKVTTRQFVQTIKEGLSQAGYNCANTFDTVLESETPSEAMEMGYLCGNKNLCALGISWYETEAQCIQGQKKRNSH